MSGERQRAKDVLAARTPLTENEVDAVVAGVWRETEESVAAFRSELAQAAESASSYAQAVLWAVFISAALALVASLAGGAVGASAVRRLPVLRMRREASA